jgi:hypothetical protein
VEAAAVRLVARDLDPGEDGVLARCGLAPVGLEELEPPAGAPPSFAAQPVRAIALTMRRAIGAL